VGDLVEFSGRFSGGKIGVSSDHLAGHHSSHITG
jgi:hypothetical protein